MWVGPLGMGGGGASGGTLRLISCEIFVILQVVVVITSSACFSHQIFPAFFSKAEVHWTWLFYDRKQKKMTCNLGADHLTFKGQGFGQYKNCFFPAIKQGRFFFQFKSSAWYRAYWARFFPFFESYRNLFKLFQAPNPCPLPKNKSNGLSYRPFQTKC